MRADAIGGRTWLLGAVAGWALCVWLLALFGLGGRIDRLPDDPSLLRTLPRAPGVQAERLGPLAQYDEIGARPVFNDDRRPQPFFINPEGEGEQADVFDFVLTSVLLTPGFRMAIVQPTGGGAAVRLKPGDAPTSAPSWTLGAINARSVVFNGPEGERTLELRVFDGTGGEPPTAAALPGSTPGASTVPNRPMPMPSPQPGTQPPAPVITKSSSPPTPAPPAAVVAPPPVTPSGEPSEAQVAADDRQAEQQAESIRQRINARRAQLRQEVQKSTAPSSSP